MSSVAAPADASAPPVRRRRRVRLLVVVGMVAVLAAGALVVWQTVRAPGLPDLPKPALVYPPATGPVVRIAPDGNGTGSTDSWEQAAPLSALPDVLRSATPGTQVWLLADAGPYQLRSPIELDAGGEQDAPVVVRGVNSDGSPAPAELVGDRADPYDPQGPKGKEVFRLLAGADHLVFQELVFRNIGNGAFRIGADVVDLTVRQITANNVRRLIENAASAPAGTATISGLTVANVTVEGFSKGVARLRYDSNRIVFDGVVGDSQQQDHDPIPLGIHLADTVHDVDIRNSAMINSLNTDRPYWNGDGFSAERETYDIRFDNTYSAGHSDAGYDLKSRSATLTRAVAADSKRNFRFWGNITVNGCTADDPAKRGGTGTQAQIHATAGAVVTLTGCTIRDDDPATIVFDIDGTARLTVTDTRVEHAPAGKIATVEPGAVLEQDAVQVN